MYRHTSYLYELPYAKLHLELLLSLPVTLSFGLAVLCPTLLVLLLLEAEVFSL